ncbi:MAG: hypothetical protein IPJ04_16295 [Candidatus Eisenbacteria bacterium]|nr:hypothetical protein [Candidatus Eisenbacteria bacterium]
MSFVVSEDLVAASPPCVHRESCGTFARRKRGATTMTWHGPIEAFGEALALAKAHDRTGRGPAVHNCIPASIARDASAAAYATEARNRAAHAVRPAAPAPAQREAHPLELSASDHFVSGVPCTFATAGERAWKQAIADALRDAPTPRGCSGLMLEFALSTFRPGGQPRDLDNLCEPVFRALANTLGWFDGSCTNLEWWSASMSVASPTGVRLRALPSRMPASRRQAPALEFVYSGPLPRSGTDASMPAALSSRVSRPLAGEAIACELLFGSRTLNLGDIATGRVKNVIDCLYPALGGKAGAPDDHRIRTLEVRRNCSEAPLDGVIVRLWN